LKTSLHKRLVRRSKSWAANALMNPLSGKLIKLLSSNTMERSGILFDLSSNMVNGTSIAQFYFNAYESAERRFLLKYLKDGLPVIELGSSIGVISSIIGKKTGALKIYVEANPELIGMIGKNLLLNNISNYRIYNYAIGSEGVDQVYFLPGKTNLLGKIVSNNEPGSKSIGVKQLSTIKRENVIGEFILVCDIEGAEIFILQQDRKALEECRQIIIEAHDTTYESTSYKCQDIKQMIRSEGFYLVDQYGPNLVFEKA
jgi:FkbM family methyltransferase